MALAPSIQARAEASVNEPPQPSRTSYRRTDLSNVERVLDGQCDTRLPLSLMRGDCEAMAVFQ
jgi:hypothetical protein